MVVGGCTAQGPGRMPSARLPQVPNLGKVYTIEPAAWGIATNGRNAQATTSGLNAAIRWANQQGYGTVRLPAGTCLMGARQSAIYTGGVELPSGIHFELGDGATIQMDRLSTHNSCAVDIHASKDVIVSGGRIRGQRDADAEEGHAICVWGASERVLIEKVTLTEAGGDDVLVAAATGGEAGASRDVTIHNNDISSNRRQGISIVGGIDVVVEKNDIHDMHGGSQEFGIDIEGRGYINRNILIDKNRFYRNRGGDCVNNDGRSVWLIENTLDQTGLTAPQSDGPIIVHAGISDQVISGNTVTVAVGSRNGHLGIVSYPHAAQHQTANIIENNLLIGGGVDMEATSRLSIRSNVLDGSRLLIGDVNAGVSCLQSDGNEARNYGGSLPYSFIDTYGQASGNLREGQPVDLPLSPDRHCSDAS